MIKTTARKNNVVRLDFQVDLEQPSWVITAVYVRPGYTLEAGRKLLMISARNIRAEQKTFLKLFYNVWRQVSNVLDQGAMLKEVERAGGLNNWFAA